MCEEIFKGSAFNTPLLIALIVHSLHTTTFSSCWSFQYASNQYETSIRNIRMGTNLRSRSSLWHANYIQCQNATPTHVCTYTQPGCDEKHDPRRIKGDAYSRMNKWKCALISCRSRSLYTHTHTHTHNPLRCSKQNTSAIHSDTSMITCNTVLPFPSHTGSININTSACFLLAFSVCFLRGLLALKVPNFTYFVRGLFLWHFNAAAVRLM